MADEPTDDRLAALIQAMPSLAPDAPAIHRLGHHAVCLLAAAREVGDAEMADLAERLARMAGRRVARGRRAN